jgi:hypothetical protein
MLQGSCGVVKEMDRLQELLEAAFIVTRCREKQMPGSWDMLLGEMDYLCVIYRITQEIKEQQS